MFEVTGRRFALVPLEGTHASVNLKCNRDLALELRARYPSVRPGDHANKRHWNTVELDGSIDDNELQWMISHSHELVVANLPRAARELFLADDR